MNFLDKVLNGNRKSKIAAWAKDATPEEIAQAMDSMAAELEARDSAKDSKNGKDAEKEEKESKDSKAKDDKEEKEEKEEKKESKDKKAKDAKDNASVKDALDEALFGSDAKEESEADDEEESEADDEALVIEPADRPKPLGPGTDGKDAAMLRADGAKSVLKVLKPFVARSGDKALINAFDTAVRTVTGKSTGSTNGGYGAVATASTTPSAAARDSVNNGEKTAAQQAVDFEKAYKSRFDARQ